MTSVTAAQQRETGVQAGKQRLTKAVWLQLCILGGGYMFYALNRFAFPVGLKDIGITYAFTAVQTSVLGTVFLLGQGIMDIPAGYMADRLNRRFLFFISMFLIGLMVICFTLFTTGFPSAVFWRVAFGMAEGCFNICLFALAGVLLPKRRAFLNNLMGAFFAVGGFLGPVLFALMSAKSGKWQRPLQIFAVATIVYAFVMLSSLRVKDKDIPALAFHKLKAAEGETFFSTLGTLVRMPKMWSAMTIYIFNIITHWGFAGVGAYMLTRIKHVDTLFAGSVIATAFGISPLVSPLLGYVADRVGRKPVIVILALIISGSLWVMLVSPTVYKPYLLIAAFLSGMGINTIYWLGYTVVQDAVPARFVGFATGMTGGCGYFVASFSGWAIGVITQGLGHLVAVYGILIGCEILVVLCALFLIPKKAEGLPGNA
jgi:MFS family permease